MKLAFRLVSSSDNEENDYYKIVISMIAGLGCALVINGWSSFLIREENRYQVGCLQLTDVL